MKPPAFPHLSLPPGSPEELAAFETLRTDLTDRFVRFANDPRLPYTAVVIPSQSFDPDELAKIPGVAHYEERSLWNLMLLRHPRVHVVFVTSKRLDPLVVDYYLHQIRGVPSAHARRRLTLLDCDDATARPLTLKILERPHLLRRIKAAITHPDNAHMSVFNATELERTLSVELGVPLNACDPRLSRFGTKTGSRKVFREAGIATAPGNDGLRDTDDLVDSIRRLAVANPRARKLVVKLDDSFSGEGNAILELATCPEAADPRSSDATAGKAIRRALTGLKLEAAGLTWPVYREQFDRMGGICEVWLEGEGKVSPSVQLRINPLGAPAVVSTHDQVLGGPSGQVFLGATFPADKAYRKVIAEQACRVGKALANHGVIGRFGVDFLVIPTADGPHDVRAVEINLRQGGTTHPYNTLKFLTSGTYDAEEGEFLTAQGRPRAYFATDTLQQERYRGLLPYDIMDALVVHGIGFGADEKGVVFHLLGCLSELGKLGCLAIAPTVPEARKRYEDAVAMLDLLTASTR
jgi:hypothetical protein